MSSIYVYAWWSGLCIEWAENKINKIDFILFFYFQQKILLVY